MLYPHVWNCRRQYLRCVNAFTTLVRLEPQTKCSAVEFTLYKDKEQYVRVGARKRKNLKEIQNSKVKRKCVVPVYSPSKKHYVQI